MKPFVLALLVQLSFFCTSSSALSQSSDWDDWEESETLKDVDRSEWAVGGMFLYGISTHAGETSLRGPFDNPGFLDRVAGGISEGGYALEELIGSWALERT